MSYKDYASTGENLYFPSLSVERRYLINKEMLKDCHEKMDGDKAVGIDGISKGDYDRNLEDNLDNLVERLKNKAYKPRPAKLVEIEKDNGKMRPLSIDFYKDKLIQDK